MGQGGQEWLSDWPAITITGMNQALLLYEHLGLEPERLCRMWRSHFVRVAEYLPLIGVHRRAPCMKGYDWAAYLWRSHHRWDIFSVVVARRLHPGTWLKRHLPRPLFAALRDVWRTAAQRARLDAGSEPMAPTPRVLVFSPALGGHRQVYCRALRISCTTPVARWSWPVLSGGSTSRALGFAGALRVVDRWSSWTPAACPWRPGHRPGGALPPGGRAACRHHRADRGRRSSELLTKQMAPGGRIPGRRVGIFLRGTRYVHVGRDPDPGGDAPGVGGGAGRLAGTLRFPRAPHAALPPARRRALPGRGLRRHTRPAVRVAPRHLLQLDEEDWAMGKPDGCGCASQGVPRAAGPGRVLVYYGSAQVRRGTRILCVLPSTSRLDSCIVVRGRLRRCGPRSRGFGRPWPREEPCSRLTRICRVSLSLASSCVRPLAVLPYRRHYVSSGVMLQALEADRPVLVPDRGLMAWRTLAFGLGRTYAEGSYEDLRRETLRLLSEEPAAYAPRSSGSWASSAVSWWRRSAARAGSRWGPRADAA